MQRHPSPPTVCEGVRLLVRCTRFVWHDTKGVLSLHSHVNGHFTQLTPYLAILFTAADSGTRWLEMLGQSLATCPDATVFRCTCSCR
jgi:hypothetical protein